VAQSALPKSKINTEITQSARQQGGRNAPVGKNRGGSRGQSRISGDTRKSVRGGTREVIEMEYGITVYPPQEAGDPWRAVFIENGQRRNRQASSEAELAAKLEKVKERRAADAVNMERPGADLIAHYLDPDRLPPDKRWSRRHADTQRRLCERFAAPVIATMTCQDIKVMQMQQIVNAAPTAKEGARLHRCLSALVTAGIRGGYLANPRLREVYWQAMGRSAPVPEPRVLGESVLFVDPAEIPSDADVAKLAQALALGKRGELDELMAYTAAYSGLRQGELFALTEFQAAVAERVITVDRKVVEIGGTLYVEAPKVRKYRSTIYPVRTPDGYPLAEKLAERADAARAEMEAGTNPLGLVFPSPKGKHWRGSNFGRRVLASAYRAAGWRDINGNGDWTWHSLRHVFCVTALTVLAGCHPDAFDFALDATEPTAADREPGLEPMCTVCEDRVGIFAARGDSWMHKEDGVTTAEPYGADHGIVIGWHPAAVIPAQADPA
jgi:integrase